MPSQPQSPMTEVQAIAYSRDVLLGCLRSGGTGGTDGDSHYSVDTLLGHPGVVQLRSAGSGAGGGGGSRPFEVEVAGAASGGPVPDVRGGGGIGGSAPGGLTMANAHEKRGWVRCRTRAGGHWKRRFCVVSEALISYYEHEFPRPHGLDKKLVLVGATVTGDAPPPPGDEASGGHPPAPNPNPNPNPGVSILHLRDRDQAKEHHIAFQTEEEMQSWATSIRRSIATCTPRRLAAATATKNAAADEPPPPSRAATSPPRSGTDAVKEKLLHALGGGKKPTEQDQPFPPEPPLPASRSEGRTGRKATDNLSFLPLSLRRSVSGGATGGEATLQAARFPDATVRVTVRATALYRICPSVEEGEDDAWGMVRTRLLRNYLLAGGTSGHMIPGEDVVELEFLKGAVREEAFELMFSQPTDGEREREEASAST